MANANRGKWSEEQVKKQLMAKAKAEADFDYQRIPDARAGSFQPALADFDALSHGRYFLLEVKEVITSKERLPYQSFSPDKVSRMVKRSIAGAHCWILLCHKPEGKVTKKDIWRLIPLRVFRERDPAKPSGSWLLEGWPLMTLDEAIMHVFEDVGDLP